MEKSDQTVEKVELAGWMRNGKVKQVRQQTEAGASSRLMKSHRTFARDANAAAVCASTATTREWLRGGKGVRLDIMERINTRTHSLIMKSVISGVFVGSAAASAIY